MVSPWLCSNTDLCYFFFKFTNINFDKSKKSCQSSPNIAKGGVFNQKTYPQQLSAQLVQLHFSQLQSAVLQLLHLQLAQVQFSQVHPFFAKLLFKVVIYIKFLSKTI